VHFSNALIKLRFKEFILSSKTYQSRVFDLYHDGWGNFQKSLTWWGNFQESLNFRNHFTIFHSSKLYMIKSTQKCIHCLSVITMHFLLFVISFTYRFRNHLSIQIYHCHLSISIINNNPQFNINKLKKSLHPNFSIGTILSFKKWCSS
jgi:uncharacterized protein YegP (UPF0339 family)